MFLLGHIGITVGIVYLLISFLFSRMRPNNPHTPSIEDIDFRLVIIASIFPDIIDKILGMLILKDEIANGRIFTHSVITLWIISICLFIVAQIKFGRGLRTLYYTLPLYIHLLLDRMWEDAHTLFWPLFGTGFSRSDIEFSDYLTILLTNPFVYITEILGALIIITLFVKHRLYMNIHFFSFLNDGKLKKF